MSDIVATIITFAIIIVVLSAARVLPVFVYNVTGREITILLLNRLRVGRIPLSDVHEVTTESWGRLLMDGTLLDMDFCGSPLLLPPTVLWRKGRRPFVITPRDQAHFVGLVSKYLQRPGNESRAS